MKKLLSNIDKIKTGESEYEVIKETTLFRLLHYKPLKKQSFQVSCFDCLCINK